MSEFIKEENPYTLQFSFVPPQYINRRKMTEEIISDLSRQVPAFRCHFITGVRGTGKTVMMADISRLMSEKEEWFVVDIEDPEADLLDSLARGLYRNEYMRNLFIKAKVDLSILGLGVSLEAADIIVSNASDALDYMLQILKKNKKRILVAIDEVTYCKQIAAFSHSLSAYARKGYDIFVLMTGLKENIKAIKNDKSLTFLYRAKEHELDALNITAIIANYENVFRFGRDKSEEMAWMTLGYSFAFQLLGYLYWEYLSRGGTSDINEKLLMQEYDQYLAEFSYEKIWSEIPRKEKMVLKAMAKIEDDNVKSVREALSMSSSEFSVYRGRLIERGLINGSEYGRVKFVLPRFREFVQIR